MGEEGQGHVCCGDVIGGEQAAWLAGVWVGWRVGWEAVGWIVVL